MTAVQTLKEKSISLGMEQGISLGIQQEKLSIAMNLLERDMDIFFITETTGLDEQTISKLKEKRTKN